MYNELAINYKTGIMKHLFLALSLVSTIPCIAQDPDPDLFQTWYLQDIYLELGPPLELIEPRIYPFLVISEDLDFSGQGSCNTFTGTYMYDPVEDSFEEVEFSRTNEDCIFQYHNQFESQYFGTVKGNWIYEISEDGVGLELHIYNLINLSATFTNYSLSTQDIEKVDITIYPNPVNDILTISSPNNEILSIRMHTIDGKEINSFKKMNRKMNEINLIGLDSGIYFLEIFTDVGQVTKKILKN